MSALLAGRHLLLTRPKGQVEALSKQLRKLGATVSCFAAIRIVAQLPTPAEMALLRQANWVLFASANAAVHLKPLLDQTESLPSDVPLGAIGQATAQALIKAGLPQPMIAPPPYNSEALLSLDALQDLHQQQVIIVRGQGGRERLAQELAARGATVHYLEVYSREPPTDTLQLDQLQDGPLHALCITSAQIAGNLLEATCKADRSVLQHAPVIAGNPRIAQACVKLGYDEPVATASNPSDEAMLETLTAYFSNPS